MEIVAYFSNEPLCLRLERHRVLLNDDLGVPRRFPAGRGSTCEDGPIPMGKNKVYEMMKPNPYKTKILKLSD